MKTIFQLRDDHFAEFWQSESETIDIPVTLFGEMPICRHDFFPAELVSELAIELEICIGKSGPLRIDIPPYFICIDDKNHFSSICLSYVTNYVAQTNKLHLKEDQPNWLKLTYSDGTIEIELNGEKFNYSCDYKPSISSVSITGAGKTQIRQLKLGVTKQSTCSIKPAEKFGCHMTVDFVDDIIPAPFTKQTLAELMKKSKALGVTRINWIYYGGKESGFWDSIRRDDKEKHTWETFDNLGDDFLLAATQAAHAEGLEIYAIVKPFDMAPFHANVPLTSELAQKIGKADILGGKMYWIDNFAANHPELCMQRRKFTVNLNQSVSTIIIETLDEPHDASDSLQIWVSDDNWKYRPYEGQQIIHTHDHQIMIDSLEINEQYFAVSITDNDQRKRVYNTLNHLIKLYDSEGQELAFTYGLEPRQFRTYGKNSTHLSIDYDAGEGFCEEGFSFDYIPGIPTSVTLPKQPYNQYFGFDSNSDGVIGIARGQNKFVPACLSPSEPETRQYWMMRIKQAMDKGVDGIDIRAQNHCNVISWDEYGFNQPIVDEFKKRHGIDIRNEEFDRQEWQQLRGEYFTDFLREVKVEVQKHSCKLQVHIEDLYEASPLLTPMNIHWDWQTWLEEKIPDEVTFKAIHFESFKTDMARKLISICKTKNIPVYYCPFLQAVTHQKKELWSKYLDDVKKSGIDAFVIYESATMFGASTGDGLVPYNPEICELIKARFMKQQMEKKDD